MLITTRNEFLRRSFGRRISLPSLGSLRTYILGIETSCDDTGAALLDSNGSLIGEALVSQTSTRFGGVIPSLAMGRHAQSLPGVVIKALNGTPPTSLRAIAVSNQPGLKGSLSMGLNYAQYLSLKLGVPLIPIHHMEAHALTPRFVYPELRFPYVFLLISGGHCILGIAKGIRSFFILGYSSNSPGEALDKIARALQLNTRYSDLRDVPGGRCIELLASRNKGNPEAIDFATPLSHKRDCNFSFTGLKAQGLLLSESVGNHEEIADFCASFQYAVGRHICMRLQRAFEYLDLEESPEVGRQLVISGGVACNATLRGYIDKVSCAYGYTSYYPPPKYCTDNGLMIAWNGYEKMRHEGESCLVRPADVLDLQPIPRSPFGDNRAQDVEEKQIKCKWIKLLI